MQRSTVAGVTSGTVLARFESQFSEVLYGDNKKPTQVW
jgi:hypothetical protein